MICTGTKSSSYRSCLKKIMMCSCSMCINIIYFLWFYPCFFHGKFHRFCSTTSIFCRRSNMERITGRTISS